MRREGSYCISSWDEEKKRKERQKEKEKKKGRRRREEEGNQTSIVQWLDPDMLGTELRYER